MNRRQKIIVSVTGIFLVLLLLVGLTYAYFLTRINGNENTKSISVTTANLALVYGDDDGSVIGEGETIEPGKTFEPKTFTVTNQGNANTDYVVVIENTSVTYATTVEVDGVTHTAGETTTFESNDFTYTLTCESGCDGVNIATTFPIEGGILVGNRIDVGETQIYSFTLTYNETGVDQSNDMNKKLEAKINIKDITTTNPYSDNTNTLAYNIINNAIVGATGTTLAGVPETDVAVSISGAEATGSKYAPVAIPESMMPYGFEPWLYADTEAGAVIGTSASGKACSDLIGKYIYDQSYSLSGTFTSPLKIESCEGEVPLANQEVEVYDYENVLSVTQDDYGTSYYYRGKVEDNYVNFNNNMCWRIVRIEGDGSIKLVLEDQDNTCETANGNFTIGYGHYGYSQGKVTNSSGQESTDDKYVADYVNSPTNTDTSMRAKFDAWLTSSGIDTSKLKKDNWCLGNTSDPYNSTGTLLTDSVNDLMYNDSVFYYDTYRRLYGKGVTANATLRCNGNNYETYESYIGALTADEVVYAGGKAGSANSNYYLLNDYQVDEQIWWWTLSPSYFNGSIDYNYADYEYAFYVDDYGFVDGTSNYFVVDNHALRPAVSLVSGAVITGGNGTQTNPYIVG